MLNNASSLPLAKFVVTPVDGSAAAVDVLAGQSVAMGQMLKIIIPSTTDVCAFDLEIEFSDGSKEKREAVDFCNTDGYIVEK